jgi:CBS domain-containing protein
MAGSKLGAMPIVERGRLLGIATITDVLDAEVRTAMAPSSSLTCADAMTPWPIVVAPEAPISEAVQLVIRHGVRHLPVVSDRSTIVGMLSERDLREAIGDLAEYLAIEPKLVTDEPLARDVMTSPAITARLDTPLAEVARLFANQRIGAVPILDRFGALMGIVSYVDVLRVLTS